MARVDVAPQTLDTGIALNPVMTAVGVDGVAIPQQAGLVIIVENTTAGALNLVIDTEYTVDNVTMPNKTVSIPATSGKRAFKNWTNPIYSHDGKVWLDGSGLSVAVLAG